MSDDTEKLVELRGAVKLALMALQSFGDTEEGVNTAYSGLSVALKATDVPPLLVTPQDRLDRIERELNRLRHELCAS
jgi:hypothetical protein